MIAIIMGFVLAVTHYFNDKLHPENPHTKKRIVSFISGVSITYIFLLLLPEVYKGINLLNKFLFMFILSGFAIFHLIEKHVYQHGSHEALRKELREVHSGMFFFYHLIIGILLVELVDISLVDGVLFFVPILFHTAVSSASLKGLHVSIRERMLIKTVLSCSTLLGVLIAYLVLVPLHVLHSLLGFMVGALLYTVIRDSLPKETEGKAIYFVMGIVIYSIIIGFTWLV